MSQYTYLIKWCRVASIEEVNRIILSDEEEPSLTSAEQIISLSRDPEGIGYLLVWKVRRWEDGGEENDHQSV